MTLALTDRLPTLDKAQLLTLRANASRLQTETGKKGDEASAILPLIDAELSRREAEAPKKTRAKAVKR